MSTAPLADLVQPLSAAQLAQHVLTGLAADGLPIGDWAPTISGGIERGIIDMVAGTIADYGSGKVADAVAGGFLRRAKSDWLTFLAKTLYRLERIPATYTVQLISLLNSTTGAPQTFKAGELWVTGPSGNKYQSIEGGTLTVGGAVGSLVLLFQAENPGASYNDVSGTLTTLVTSRPGVTAINRATIYPFPAGLAIGGTSKGRIEPIVAATFGGVLLQDRYRIRIVKSGTVAARTAQFSFSTDDGRTWSPAQGVTKSVVLPNTGCALLFYDSAVSASSFVAGDEFYFANTAVVQQGSDVESDAQLAARCRARWLTLSDVPTPGTVELWARLASPEVNRVRVASDPNAANTMLVYLAGSSGRIGPQTSLTVQAYLTARLEDGENANALSVDVHQIAVTGNVQVPREQMAAIQTAAERNWTAYLASIPIGGAVVLAELEQAVMDAGARDFLSAAITGGSPNVVLSGNEVAVPASGTTLVSALNWEAF